MHWLARSELQSRNSSPSRSPAPHKFLSPFDRICLHEYSWARRTWLSAREFPLNFCCGWKLRSKGQSSVTLTRGGSARGLQQARFEPTHSGLGFNATRQAKGSAVFLLIQVFQTKSFFSFTSQSLEFHCNTYWVIWSRVITAAVSVLKGVWMPWKWAPAQKTVFFVFIYYIYFMYFSLWIHPTVCFSAVLPEKGVFWSTSSFDVLFKDFKEWRTNAGKSTVRETSLYISDKFA